MANPIYGYNSSYGGSALSSVYPQRLAQGSVSDPYHSDPSRYLTSDPLSTSDFSKYSVGDRGASMFMNQNDGLRFSAGFGVSAVNTQTPQLLSQTTWPGVDVDPVSAGVKRPSDAFYHQNVLGTNNTFGQNEALFTMSLSKRPRFESAGNLPIYPQRPGEKDCAHYMLTRTCNFGDRCRFDHPIWVPEGGIPDWREVPLPIIESLPERPGEPDCPYFLKTQNCKFGSRCKFNHPKDKVDSLVSSETVNAPVLPERPSEPTCSFYMKTGKCKFAANCKYHHPKDIQIPPAEQENGNVKVESVDEIGGTDTKDGMPVKPFVFTPALLHNSKGLPIRPSEESCPFYLKTGSCKYGASCRYNHPDRNAINPPVAAAMGQSIITPSAVGLNIGALNPAASIFSAIDPRLTQAAMGFGPTIYPQRPGEMECDFYMKTGQCKFGERCRFNHPIDRSAPTPSMPAPVPQQTVKLTLAGLPRREGAIICPYYMKTGACKFAVACKFDHPPPGEAIAMAATVQGTTTTVEGEGEGEGEGEVKDEAAEEQQET